MGEKFLGRSKRKRNWGRSMRVDSWDKLELVVNVRGRQRKHTVDGLRRRNP